MFKGEYGACKGDCGKDRVWIVNKSRYMCQWCNEKVKKLKKIERKTGLKPKKLDKPKKKGTMALFQAIWATRPHVSEISGERLPQFDIWNFAHILSKGSHPKFALKPENICLMTRAEHDLYDNRGGVEELAETHEGWRKLLDRKLKLKAKYND